ncbi:uncharacterized protein BDV14DRAFT_202312 [Aspergillus stella-maris]|uniref:uncharacterized protein n=1 Tax=Aspergillus stella-maris TaxID=1810926 RepID=UPI003CCD5AB3
MIVAPKQWKGGFSKRFSLRRKSSQDNASLSIFKHDQEDEDSRGPPSRAQSQPSLASPKKTPNETNPLGLNVIYAPRNGHKADIVFVHGLGGTSRWTWSKDHNDDLFWPLTFLPLEPDLCLARILSFGYNAKFQKKGNTSTAVLDFAKTLLFDLKYALDQENGNLNIGSVPLLFVVHSMGGLIVKEAYMQGQNDERYEHIVKSISAILFLATPHRGSNLAAVLNRVLEATWLSNSKVYISELSSDSLTLQKLNEQFRHIAPRLDIVSFYETQPTPIKGARVMILEKDSSTLGYPGEISKSLDADHHGVCKYEDRRDPNYITVRNALKSIVSKIISTVSPQEKTAITHSRKPSDLKNALGLPQLPDVDFIFFKDQWTAGTSNWILEDERFVQWLTSSRPSLLFAHGGAATGKSVLASFIINHLVERGVHCQYFFIRFADRKKRTLSLLLRSLAYQITEHIPEFGVQIAELANEAVEFGTADPRTIWERLFKSVLFKMEETQPIYWVIDGLDEADDVRSTVKLLADIQFSSIPIHVLLLGRDTTEITTALVKLPNSLPQGAIKIEGHVEDFYAHIDQELTMGGSDEFRDNIVQRIVAGAQDNFLWVRLAVEKLNTCITSSDASDALREFPPGMEALYDRMALSIANKPSDKARYLARRILQCVACSFRVLTIAELSQALSDDFSDMLDLERSIMDLCGGFVVLDNSGHVAMIHHSAREYFLSEEERPIAIDRDDAHEQMFMSCMNCLTSSGVRAKLHRSQKLEFPDYSASSWSSHLAMAPEASQPVYKALRKFLTGHWVLSWIHILVITKQLRILVRAAKHLSKYAASRRDIQVGEATSASQLAEWQLLEQWATDFVKILGKFGNNLRRNPEAIYKTIAPFCPVNSAIFQQFGKTEAKLLKVSGLSNPDWDDSIARLSFGSNASSILAAGKKVAVSTSRGSVFLYYSSDFEELNNSPIRHGEYMYRMALNNAGTQLVTYGYKTTKIWEISTGRCTLKVDNLDSRPRPLEIMFTNGEKTLLVGFDDRTIRSLNLKDPSPSWQLVAELEEDEIDGHFLNSASYMALNSDGTLAAVAYRGHPLSAWEIDGPTFLDHCWRAREERSRGEVLEMVWHPHAPELLGIYIEGIVFKWNPYEGSPQEIRTDAARLAISRDGHLFATGDVRGTVKVYTTSDFQLLFQLPSQDPVLGLAFGPSLHRFYDIRGLYGNAWEPNALMRYAERLDKSPDSDADSTSLGIPSTAPTAMVRRVDSITAIAVCPLGGLYCTGTQLGVVRLYDKKNGLLADLHVSKGLHGVEQLVWSPDGKYICYSDNSKYVTVISITPRGSGISGMEAETIFKMSMDKIPGPIVQLLFPADASHLLVSSPSMACIISLDQSSVVSSLEWQSGVRKWILNPQNETLITFEPTSISIFDWNLINIRNYAVEYSIDEDPPSPTSEDPENQARIIDRILTTPDKRYFVVQISLEKALKGTKYLFSLPTASFPPYAGVSLDTTSIGALDTAVRLSPVPLPQEVTAHIASILTLISHDRLMFLSKSFGICSWKHPLNKPAPSPSRPALPPSSSSFPSSWRDADANRFRATERPTSAHRKDAFDTIFMLPGDWIGRDALSLCTIWKKERSLLCPRNGEVAIVTAAGLG